MNKGELAAATQGYEDDVGTLVFIINQLWQFGSASEDTQDFALQSQVKSSDSHKSWVQV